jgi:hypothetical protein
MAELAESSSVRREITSVRRALEAMRETYLDKPELLLALDSATSALSGPTSPFDALFELDPMLLWAEGRLTNPDPSSIEGSGLWGSIERLAAGLCRLQEFFAGNGTMRPLIDAAYLAITSPDTPLQRFSDYLRVLDRLRKGETSQELIDSEFGWPPERTDRAFALITSFALAQPVKPKPQYVLTPKGRAAANRILKKSKRSGR